MIHLVLSERRNGEAIFVPSLVFYLIITKLFKTEVFHVSVGALHYFGLKETACGKSQAFYYSMPQPVLL